MLNINVDLVQRVKVSGLFFLQFYKILTGTLLTLFIPQNCDDKICTLTSLLRNLIRVLSFHCVVSNKLLLVTIISIKCSL